MYNFLKCPYRVGEMLGLTTEANMLLRASSDKAAKIIWISQVQSPLSFQPQISPLPTTCIHPIHRLSWFNSSRQISTTQPLAHSSLVGLGREFIRWIMLMKTNILHTTTQIQNTAAGEWGNLQSFPWRVPCPKTKRIFVSWTVPTQSTWSFHQLPAHKKFKD